MKKAVRGDKRPLPRTIDAWSREVLGIKRLLAELPHLTDDNGSKWVSSVKKYNTARLKHLTANKPTKTAKK